MKLVDVNTKISVEELKPMAAKMFNNIVKAVVDVEKEIMVVDAGLHSDEEEFLLEEESEQKNLWGINLHHDKFPTEEFVEFDSMINLRPDHGNNSRGIDDIRLQKKIKGIVNKLVVQ